MNKKIIFSKYASKRNTGNTLGNIYRDQFSLLTIHYF